MTIPPFETLIQPMQEAFDRAPHFSGIALFEMGGTNRMVWQNGYADEEMKTPHTLTTQFSIASVSKQFTTVALLMALSEKEADLPKALQRTLATYLPTYEAPWVNAMTLHQLLTHTTGLDNYTDFPFEEQIKAINDGPDVRNHLSAFIKTLTQNPAKVGMYHYSNTNYHVLSLVVEGLTRMTLGEYIAKVIFTPLGMTDTVYFCDSTNDVLKREGILPRVALGYVLDPTQPEIEKRPCPYYENYGVSAGDGSIVSTVSDLHTWCVDLFRNHTVIPKLISDLIFQPHVLDPVSSHADATYWYGYGMGCVECKNPLLNHFWHDGLTYGYTSFVGYFPHLDAIYIKLSNFAEDCFIDSKERDAVRQHHPHLDTSPNSENIITKALEKRYVGYGDHVKSIHPDVVASLKNHLKNSG